MGMPHKRIVQNTLALYVRMLIVMGTSLYTSRIVLQLLGFEDFGIYSLVGSFVGMFVFWAMSLSGTAQRYIAYELGTPEKSRLREVFGSLVSVHIVIAVAVVILLEFFGIWFFRQKINIPPEKIPAALVIFHTSVLSCVCGIISIPYLSAVIAHEKMTAFAYFGIFEVIAKLVSVFVLYGYSEHRLIVYGILQLAIALILLAVYILYQIRYFPACGIMPCIHVGRIKDMLQFSGWNLIGSSAWMLRHQGINVLLNLFFGPTVNAAMGIANQLNNVVTQFVGNFRTAVNPQITKYYAQDNHNFVYLAIASAKYSYYMLLFLALPLIFETEFVLTLWLKNVPPETVGFARLTMGISLMQCVQASLESIFLASARVKTNQIICALFFIAILPIAYLILRYGGNPISVLWVSLGVTAVVALGVKGVLLHRMFAFSYRRFWDELLLPMIRISAISILMPTIIHALLFSGWLRFLCVGSACVLSTLCAVYFLDIPRDVRSLLWHWIRNKVQYLLAFRNPLIKPRDAGL